jgi:hypothetical protein
LGFVIFWQKNIGAKADCKKLVKLTKGCEKKVGGGVKAEIFPGKLLIIIDVSF